MEETKERKQKIATTKRTKHKTCNINKNGASISKKEGNKKMQGSRLKTLDNKISIFSNVNNT